MKSKNIFDKNPIITQIVLIIVTMLILMLLMETGLRFTPLNAYVDKTLGFPAMHVNDKDAGYDLVDNFKGGLHSTIDIKYKVHTNNIGCYDNPVRMGQSYNLLIGDSFTWGFSPIEKKWTTKLENETGVRFLKCGVSGYGAKQALAKAKKIVSKMASPPKLIIYSYFWNDLNDDYLHPTSVVYDGKRINTIKSFDYSTGKVEHYSTEEINKQYDDFVKHGNSGYSKLSFKDKILVELKNYSIIANILNSYISNSKRNLEKPLDIAYGAKAKYYTLLPHLNPEEAPWLKQAWDEHLRNIYEIKKYANTLGSELIVVIIPEKSFIYSSDMVEKKKINIKNSYSKLHKYLSKNNIRYIDLLDSFVDASKPGAKGRIKDLYWPHDVHWNHHGESLAGQNISDFIISNELIK